MRICEAKVNIAVSSLDTVIAQRCMYAVRDLRENIWVHKHMWMVVLYILGMEVFCRFFQVVGLLQIFFYQPSCERPLVTGSVSPNAQSSEMADALIK